MKRLASCVAAGFIAAVMVAPASAAGMAPTYVSSEPSDGEELHRAPARVEVTFSEPLDESSDLTVEDSCGRTVDDGRVEVDGSTIRVGIALKPSGHYQVSYSATGLAGITGTTEGGFHFMVHFGPACGGGGGHNNHGGKKDGGGDGGGHNQHGGGDGNQPEGGGSGEHSGMDHGSSGGGTQTHSGGHMSAGRSGGKDHAGMHGKKQRNRTGKGHGKHRDHAKKPAGTATTPPDDRPTLADGGGRPVPPDGKAVMFALGFSLTLGAVGGWFLRVSAAR